MAQNNTLLVLRLEGVLQAWGEDSKWDFRDSSNFPTRSGIVGLLGCAMGLPKDSPALIDLSKAISIAVRADRPGEKVQDFQTVTGHDLMTANKTPRKIGGQPANTIITPRSYLSDAAFTVFIETSASFREQIVDALSFPKWTIYLGRKCCVPSRPVLIGETADYDSIMDAVKRYPCARRCADRMPYECEIPGAASISLERPDVPAGTGRQFGLRRVWRGVVRKEDIAPNVFN